MDVETYMELMAGLTTLLAEARQEGDDIGIAALELTITVAEEYGDRHGIVIGTSDKHPA